MKANRWIDIAFDKPIVGDVSRVEPVVAYRESNVALGRIPEVSGQYSSQYGYLATDTSASSYWRPNSLPAWISLDVESPDAVITHFITNAYSSSYIPRGMRLQGSSDKIDWSTLWSGEGPSTGYSAVTHTLPSPVTGYRYYRLCIDTSWSSYVYLADFQLWERTPMNNEAAFTVTAKEYQYVPNGPLVDKEYVTKSVSRVDEYTIRLEIDPHFRFNNAVGPISVEYNPALGNLSGIGGARVKAFTEDFLPVDLEPTPNYMATENMSMRIACATDFTRVYYANAFQKPHSAGVSIKALLTLTYVGEINP